MSNSNNYLLKCPICNKKMWLSGATAHRESKHSDLTNQEFEALIIDGVKSGAIQPRKFGEPNKSLVSGTTRLGHERKYNKLGVRSLVSGGRTK